MKCFVHPILIFLLLQVSCCSSINYGVFKSSLHRNIIPEDVWGLVYQLDIRNYVQSIQVLLPLIQLCKMCCCFDKICSYVIYHKIKSLLFISRD